MKKCNTCNEVKALEEFQKRASNKDGYTGKCKVCKREYDNAHYKSNPSRKTYIRANSDKRVSENRDYLREYFQTHPCIDCGEDDILVLEFDHRGDKVADVSNMIRKNNLASLIIEIAKCDVRCANCHRRKTARDLGSWRIA